MIVQKVECIRERDIVDASKKGEKYYLNVNSIYINQDGDVFGDFYDLHSHKFVGNWKLNRFRTVEGNRDRPYFLSEME